MSDYVPTMFVNADVNSRKPEKHGLVRQSGCLCNISSTINSLQLQCKREITSQIEAEVFGIHTVKIFWWTSN